jgi:hypothetical protein
MNDSTGYVVQDRDAQVWGHRCEKAPMQERVRTHPTSKKAKNQNGAPLTGQLKPD